jgi:hypothetical protein
MKTTKTLATMCGALLFACALGLSQTNSDTTTTKHPKTKSIPAEITKVDLKRKIISFKNESGTELSLPFDDEKLGENIKAGNKGTVKCAVDDSGKPMTITGYCSANGTRCNYNTECCSKFCSILVPNPGVCANP